jgi:putative oxidoreductase
MATTIPSPAQAGTATRADILPLIARTLMSLLFLISGMTKVMAPGATIAFIASTGLPFPALGLPIALAVEFGASTALLFGYHTRAAAIVMGLFCLATAIIFHAHFSDPNQLMHFFKNITMAGGFLQVVAFGPGRYSLDARRR